MQNQKNNSSLPLAIIGLVLLVALGGGWWWYSSSKSQPVKSNTNSPVDKNAGRDKTAQELYANAPIGAQPANMLGSPTSTVTVEEFADYQCPTCGLIYPKMKEINSIYGNRIKFIFHNFPLPMHQHGYEASVAAEAAGLQDRSKFWQMQDQLFTNRKDWENAADARKIFEDYAQKIGLDVATFQTDVAGLRAKTRVDADLERGRKLNISGTPTIFINGRQVEQLEVSAMRQIIDAELQKANAQTQPNATANQTAETTNQPANNSNNSQGK